MRRRLIHPWLVLLAGLALSGCWESTDVTFHQPGVYYGPEDDLSTNRTALQERMAGQHDR